MARAFVRGNDELNLGYPLAVADTITDILGWSGEEPAAPTDPPVPASDEPAEVPALA